MERECDYFSRRANEERLAAMKAADRSARDAHLEMAQRYADLAGAIESREIFLGLDTKDAI